MVSAASNPEAIAVLDVGKTNVKLLAIATDGAILSSRAAPNAVRTGEPYLHCDVDHIWRWMMAALADLGERFRILAIVPTSYGSTAALVSDSELALPILDYEADPPRAIARSYADAAPWFEECCCPINPAGLTLGRQLFWLSHQFAEGVAKARWILPFAQYWAWGLSGVPACEATSIGAQTQLWNPRLRDFSTLAKREGWVERFAPMRNAWDQLGPLQLEVAQRCNLPTDTPVLCGIHDSNANFARYLAAGLDDFTLVSTGTWMITFNPKLSLDRLDPLRDTVANTDLLGRPVASARFMAGREYAEIAGEEGLGANPDAAAVEALIAAGTMALPSFTDSGGPYPGTGGKGRIDGWPPDSAVARAALASLYVALMADTCLDLLESREQVVIDGSFAENRMFAGLLAALRPRQTITVSRERNGTALGAALLFGWAERQEPVALDLEPVAPLAVAGLGDYAARWRAAADAVDAAWRPKQDARWRATGRPTHIA